MPALYDFSGALDFSAWDASSPASGIVGSSDVQPRTEFLWTGGANEAFVAEMTSRIVRQPDLTAAASSPKVVQGFAVRNRFLFATADAVQMLCSVSGA
jgi:hypothetical protein